MMKGLILLVAIGLASASYHESSDVAADDFVQNFKEDMEKTSSLRRHADFDDLHAELNLRDVLLKIRDHLKNNVDPELLKKQVEKLFGEGSELMKQFLQLIKEKATRKLQILIDRLLDDDDESDREVRGISDYWEKVKDYFKDLKIDLQEKYMKFGDWVKNNWEKGMDHSKDKLANIKAIAVEFTKHAKGISKEVANEAGEFFRQYKDQLGDLWDEIKDRLSEIKNRKD